ncbi:putative PEP-binding protein [Archangium sp.]|uniref:putative PEP-binding protein n=1 Tax=Archangium sp. TaxID=1872627 RepID=UPI00286ADE0B|nr:putative PEP-binding protein [Archangium sp.]
MLTLTREDVRLGCRAADWRAALAQAAEALVQAGRVSAEYGEGLLAREAQSSTYLGHGIAIPHGTPESRRHVRSTGVRVLQFPEGVQWHDGARVNLLVTIAAQSDEHLDILRQLTHVLGHEGVAQTLASATSADEVITTLSRAPVKAKLDAETLCLGVPARDRLELALAAAARLRHVGCVDASFVASVAAQLPVPLGQGLWLAYGASGVKTPALALATPQRRLQDDAGDVAGVFCLAAQGADHRALLERLDGLLARGEGEGLAGLPAEQLLEHPEEPDLETQLSDYREAFDALAGRPLVARTLDVGGDKPLSYWPMAEEENPFLGLRGIRLTLTRPEVMETQLRALLMAAGTRPLRIMFPMVKDIDEFRAGRAIFERVQAEVKATDVQLGTNDLTQYTLAIDRGHPQLSAQSDALHPGVLRLIQMTVEAAHAEGRWVGLGVDELSVSACRVPLVKARIRELTLPRARELAELALKQPTAAAVREALEAV